ncbi:MAG: leucine-rich repeat domain-containing protein, partial [Pontiellaceae bacterium]|nr:leucine-rich repeat domain-containing protein [Pontiellaceae bacterium]
MKKYMKFAGLLFVLVFPVAVNAGDFLYTTNSGTITITGYTGSGGDVVIPDTINDLPVTRIGYRAFYNRTSLTGITMPVGLTNIDYEAFANCSGLTGITLPAALTGIGYYAFDNCRGLKGGLMIPSGVTNIGYRAFRNCSGLTGSLTLPVALTGIGCEAFYNCYGLTGGLTIPAGVTYIGLYEYFDMYASYDAFFGCSALTSITVDGLNTNYSSVDGVLYNKEQTMLLRCLEGRTGSLTIPAGVTSIETIACVNCSKLTGNLTIPAGVTNIGNGAFYNCSGLTGNLTIPASASMRYPSQVFYNCIGLTSITVDALSTNYSSFDGVLYNKAQTSLLLCPLGKTSDLFVPDSVTNIPLQQEYGDSYRFYLSQCGALTSITV